MIGRPEYTLTRHPPVQPTGTTSPRAAGRERVIPALGELGEIARRQRGFCVLFSLPIINSALRCSAQTNASRLFHATDGKQRVDG